MRIIVIIIFVVLSIDCFGQFHFDKSKISKETEQIVSKIEGVNQLMGNAVYAGGLRPEQFDNFTELQKNATERELVALTNHPNGVVRCYSFWALTLRPAVNLLPMVVTHINDETLVKTQFGCIGGREKVGDLFVGFATSSVDDGKNSRLTDPELIYLDSMLIYTNNNLNAKGDAISRARLTEKFYERARELVLKENNQSALVALARFRREKDISIILNNKDKDDRYSSLFFTYKAISEFPHDAFLPLLKKSLKSAITEKSWSSEWQELYRAIASYKDETALELLKMPFSQTKYSDVRSYHTGFIFAAVQEFYVPFYDELLWKLWENEKQINTNIFSLLYSRNAEKAFDLTKRTIENINEFSSQGRYNFSGEGDNSDNLLQVMFDTLIVKDKPYAIQMVNKNIREIDVQRFPFFANLSLQIRDSSFVTSLFYRLASESNPHVYLPAFEALIAFEDKKINNRILNFSKENPEVLKDWGGRDFVKLLCTNGLSVPHDSIFIDLTANYPMPNKVRIALWFNGEKWSLKKCENTFSKEATDVDITPENKDLSDVFNRLMLNDVTSLPDQDNIPGIKDRVSDGIRYTLRFGLREEIYQFRFNNPDEYVNYYPDVPVFKKYKAIADIFFKELYYK